MTITLKTYEPANLTALIVGYLIHVVTFVTLALVVTVDRQALQRLIALKVSLL